MAGNTTREIMLAAAEEWQRRAAKAELERDAARRTRDDAQARAGELLEAKRAAEERILALGEMLRDRLDACQWTTLGAIRAQIDKWILVGSEDAGAWVRGVYWGGMALNFRDVDEGARALLPSKPAGAAAAPAKEG